MRRAVLPDEILGDGRGGFSSPASSTTARSGASVAIEYRARRLEYVVAPVTIGSRSGSLPRSASSSVRPCSGLYDQIRDLPRLRMATRIQRRPCERYRALRHDVAGRTAQGRDRGLSTKCSVRHRAGCRRHDRRSLRRSQGTRTSVRPTWIHGLNHATRAPTTVRGRWWRIRRAPGGAGTGSTEPIGRASWTATRDGR